MPAFPLLVIQPWRHLPMGCLAERAEQVAMPLQWCRLDDGDDVPPDLANNCALLVFGGPFGAYEDARYPWLSQIKTLIAVAIVARLPLLGISLGHQLIAVALGGHATLNPHGPARGLEELTLTTAAASDRLFATVPPSPRIPVWHDDVVSEIPHGAVPLAHSPDGTLAAVRYTDYAWGLQGNPEVTPDAFDAWTLLPPPPRRPEPSQLSGVAAQIRHEHPQICRTWAPVLDGFLTLAADRRAACEDRRSEHWKHRSQTRHLGN